MYFSVTNLGNLRPDMKGIYIFSIGKRLWGNPTCTGISELKITEVLTAEEIGQISGGN